MNLKLHTTVCTAVRMYLWGFYISKAIAIPSCLHTCGVKNHDRIKSLNGFKRLVLRVCVSPGGKKRQVCWVLLSFTDFQSYSGRFCRVVRYWFTETFCLSTLSGYNTEPLLMLINKPEVLLRLEVLAVRFLTGRLLQSILP